jgi:hypothetical protein
VKAESDLLLGNVALGLGSGSLVQFVAPNKSQKISVAEELEAGRSTDSGTTEDEGRESHPGERSGHEVLGAHVDSVEAQMGEEALRGSEHGEHRGRGVSYADLVFALG